MSDKAKTESTEKERRAQALQKALRDNLRRRKAAVAEPGLAGGETPEKPASEGSE